MALASAIQTHANMQTICTSLQTDNHTSHLITQFLQAGYSSWRPTNSVKTLKATTGAAQQQILRLL